MEPTHAKDEVRESKTMNEVDEAARDAVAPLRRRVEHARDLALDLKERAEMILEERPYLLPVATGVLGFSVGVLVASKLSRMLVLTAAGALLNDGVRTQVAKISRELIKELGERGDEEEELGSPM